MEAVGEPASRCGLGALFVDGGIVVHTSRPEPLQPGDRVVSIDGIDVLGKTYSEIRGVLKKIAPTATVSIELLRADDTLKVDAPCEDAMDSNTVLRDAFAAASKGKFDDCLTALGQRQDLGTAYWLMRLNCAAYSRSGGNQYDPQNLFGWLSSYAGDVRWQPEAQPKFLEVLHKAEPMFAASSRQDLHAKVLQLTRTWPGAAANAYAKASPNWYRFRVKAEEAIRARLIDPSSAQFTWTNGFLYGTWKPPLQKRVEGYWSCGLVNARNRMGGFAGRSSFVVVMPNENTVSFADIGTGQDFDILAMQCAKSAKLLPPVPAEMMAETAPTSALPSIADELAKLAALREKGIITQEEFDSQKAKLLSR